jgi:cellulose synthase/poly-beta-1,6-N-acetylglucosamine synthase-like glycosyltransferase
MDVRLMFGMAPDDIHSTMTQRLRYAMGALQILIRENPLKLVGSTSNRCMAANLFACYSS